MLFATHWLPHWQTFYTSSFWSLAVCKSRERKPGESYHLIHGTADVTDSSCTQQLIHILVHSYGEASEPKRVAEGRQVLPGKHFQG